MIRRADPGDVNALRAIAAAAYHKYVPWIDWNPPLNNRRLRAADTRPAGMGCR